MRISIWNIYKGYSTSLYSLVYIFPQYFCSVWSRLVEILKTDAFCLQPFPSPQQIFCSRDNLHNATLLVSLLSLNPKYDLKPFAFSFILCFSKIEIKLFSCFQSFHLRRQGFRWESWWGRVWRLKYFWGKWFTLKIIPRNDQCCCCLPSEVWFWVLERLRYENFIES